MVLSSLEQTRRKQKRIFAVHRAGWRSVTAVPAPYVTHVSFRKEPSPSGHGGRMGKSTSPFY